MRLIFFIGFGALVVSGLVFFVDTADIARMAAGFQREFQNQMAGAVRALKSGDTAAYVTLFSGAAAYGFFHAVGPGHGKALIGGVGLGSAVTAKRLLGLSVVSSLLQSLWAIVLVYGGFWLVSVSARQMTGLAENLLAPMSYVAIAGVGAILVVRGGRVFWAQTRGRADTHSHQHHDHDHHGHDHAESCGCGGHGPTPEQVSKLTSPRDTIALIASIAIRPCTGAIFLLVITWQMDLLLAGAGAAIVMGVGTASFTSLVAISSVAARAVTLSSASQGEIVMRLAALLQITAGGFVIWISILLLKVT
jgi:ABC-type nickel/cobalt efflux system permease component RcnA